MPISGTFAAFNATQQPQRDRVNHLGPPTLSDRHSATAAHAGFIGPTSVTDRIPDGPNPRSAAVTGGGAPWVTPLGIVMRALGINRDLSRATDMPADEFRGGQFNEQINSEHETSHAPGYRPGSQTSPIARGVSNRTDVGGGRVMASGNPRRPAWFPVNHASTAAVRGAFVADFTPANDTTGGNPRKIGARASARAHSDRATTRVTGHQYRPAPAPSAGDQPDPRDMPETLGYGIGFTGRMLAKVGNDGFTAGPDDPEGGTFRPTNHTGGTHSRQWFTARYSSPTLGAMYSENPLRGVLPNTIASTFPQPGTSGYKGSDIPPNQRPTFPRFVTPTMFRSPPSERDTITAVNDGSGQANAMGLGI